MAVPARFLADFRTGCLLTVLSGFAVPRTDSVHYCQLLEPVFSIIIAAIALGETARFTQVLGIILVLVAIVIVQLPEQKKEKAVVTVPVD